MKNLILIIAALVITNVAIAQEKGNKGLNKEEFVAAQKAKSKKKSWKFRQEKVEAKFDAMDVDGNGLVTGKEKKEYWAKNPKK